MAEIDIFKELEKIKSLLMEQNIFQKEVLNFKEAAEFLSLSSSYLYKLTSGGVIPHYKPEGKMIFFNRNELMQWLQRNRVKPSNEIEIAASTEVAIKSGSTINKTKK